MFQVSRSWLYVCVFRRTVPAVAADQPRVEGRETPGPGSWRRRRHGGDGSPFQTNLCNRGITTHEMAPSEEELQVSCESQNAHLFKMNAHIYIPPH